MIKITFTVQLCNAANCLLANISFTLLGSHLLCEQNSYFRSVLLAGMQPKSQGEFICWQKSHFVRGTQIAWASLGHLNTQTSFLFQEKKTHHQYVGWHNISMAPFCSMQEQACYFKLDVNTRKYPKWHSGWPWLRLGLGICCGSGCCESCWV